MLENISFPRIVKHWNTLPREVVDGPNLTVFKTHLENMLNNTLQLLFIPEVVRQLDQMTVVPSN